MKKNRWIAFLAAVSLFTVSCAPAAEAARIRIIGTEESEIETEAAVLPEESVPADSAAADTPAAGDEKILNPVEENLTAEEAVSQ